MDNCGSIDHLIDPGDDHSHHSRWFHSYYNCDCNHCGFGTGSQTKKMNQAPTS